MVRSHSKGDMSKGSVEPSRGRGRGRSNLPLAIQRAISKKATANIAPDTFETSEYVPTAEASVGNSVQAQPEAQSQQLWGRFNLVDESSSAASSSEGSKGDS